MVAELAEQFRLAALALRTIRANTHRAETLMPTPALPDRSVPVRRSATAA
jgi:hypothetical protein